MSAQFPWLVNAHLVTLVLRHVFALIKVGMRSKTLVLNQANALTIVMVVLIGLGLIQGTLKRVFVSQDGQVTHREFAIRMELGPI